MTERRDSDGPDDPVDSDGPLDPAGSVDPASRDDHVDLDTLADLDAGLLPPADERSAQAHLAGCSVCAARLQAVQSVPAALASAGSVEPMPAEVAARLESALRAEAGRAPDSAEAGRTPEGNAADPAGPSTGPTTAPTAPTAPTATVTPLSSRERPALGMRVLQAAAVLVLVLGGLGLVGTALQNGANDATTAESTAGGAADAGGGRELSAEDSSGYPVTASGRNWSPDTVVAGVPEIVSGSAGPPASPPADSGGAGAESPPATPGGEDVARLAGGPTLAECVGNLNLGPVTPLGVDLALWEGNPAAVIVLPTPDDPATADVFVVEPSCPAGQFLYFARAARP